MTTPSTTHVHSGILGTLSGLITGGAAATSGAADLRSVLVGVGSAAVLAITHEVLAARTRVRTELDKVKTELHDVEAKLPAVVRAPVEAETATLEADVTKEVTHEAAPVITRVQDLEAQLAGVEHELKA